MCCPSAAGASKCTSVAAIPLGELRGQVSSERSLESEIPERAVSGPRWHTGHMSEGDTNDESGADESVPTRSKQERINREDLERSARATACLLDETVTKQAWDEEFARQSHVELNTENSVGALSQRNLSRLSCEPSAALVMPKLLARGAAVLHPANTTADAPTELVVERNEIAIDEIETYLGKLP
jgi:hypothetical protein